MSVITVILLFSELSPSHALEWGVAESLLPLLKLDVIVCSVQYGYRVLHCSRGSLCYSVCNTCKTEFRAPWENSHNVCEYGPWSITCLSLSDFYCTSTPVKSNSGICPTVDRGMPNFLEMLFPAWRPSLTLCLSSAKSLLIEVWHVCTVLCGEDQTFILSIQA